jgi:hypothetical protein
MLCYNEGKVMQDEMLKALEDVKVIFTEEVPNSLLPHRVRALRINGSVVEAGDKFLNQAIVKLFFILTGVMYRTTDIKKELLCVKDRIDFDQSLLKVL